MIRMEEKNKKIEKTDSPDEEVEAEDIKEEMKEESESGDDTSDDENDDKDSDDDKDDNDKDSEEDKDEEKDRAPPEEDVIGTHIYALRTTANREDQVMDFLTSNVQKRKLGVYSVIRPHGLRGYIFVEAGLRVDAEQAAFNVPYARGLLPNEIQYPEIEHMLEQAKAEYNIKKDDIVEIISGAFKREQAKVTRIDKTKEEVVVELLQAAVPIPITLKIDAVKVIRREDDEEEQDY